MSSSHDESGNTSPTIPVKTEHRQNDNGEQQKQTALRRSAPPPNRRNQSSSLLSRLLAPTLEVEEDAVGPLIPEPQGTTFGSGSQTAHSTAIEGGLDDTKSETHPGFLRDSIGNSNGIGISGQRETRSPTSFLGDSTESPTQTDTGGRPGQTNSMAMMTATRGGALSLGASPTSGSAKFDMSDMTHVNNMLNSHRVFLNQHRGRGHSLERTHKERRVHAVQLTAASTNPGDTGISRPSTPLSSDDMSTMQEGSPLDAVRARYRSWRDARPGAVAAEKAWSIGRDDAGVLSEGQVEKSIADALAGIEPNSRSRKASHSLRFFKEGLPEEPKRKDSTIRGRSKDQSQQRVQDFVNSGIGSSASLSNMNGSIETSSTPGQRRQASSGAPLSRTVSASSATMSPTKKAATTDDADLTLKRQNSSNSQTEKPNALPQQLLDDLRKRHNLTPAPKKGYSFSKSAPIAEVEKSELPKDDDKTLFTKEAVEEGDSQAQESSADVQDDDEESGEEQISSALFVPHQSSREPKLRLHQRNSSEMDEISREHRDSSVEPEQPEQWLVKHQIPTQDVAESTENVSDQDMSLPPAPPLDEHPFDTSETDYFPDPQTPSDFEDTASEAGYMSRGYESGMTDGEETTPTGTLKEQSAMTRDNTEHLHQHQQTQEGPPAAIELIPYRHQVGGHTTMWRFSKRAVCKQLNNRENEFYEKIEHNHPKLLKFMPRYIGVLNVTFEKNKKKPKDELENSSQAGGQSQETGEVGSNEKPEENQRMISQSMANSSQFVTPSVTIADNRHIIPKSFLPSIAAHTYANRRIADTAPSTNHCSQSQPSLPAVDPPLRPRLGDKHANSWGATSVNRDLRYEVFGEAFSQQIPVVGHRKPSQRSIPHRPGKSSKLRNSNSESNLTVLPENQNAEESFRKKAMKAAAERLETSPTKTEDSGAIPTTDDGTASNFDEQAGTSAPDPETKVPELERQKGKRRRRYSSGALRRKPDEVADDRGILKYFEEADDANYPDELGYGGDGEDDVFKMDAELKQPDANIYKSSDPNLTDDVPLRRASTTGTMLPAGRDGSYPLTDDQASEIPLTLHRPVNPNQARTQPGQRVEFFLLLEDLTSGMKRPCIMDLKMGTRQYGVDANEKKQKSQRTKCAETTSRELGVRVCGLQVWDKSEKKYFFQDKYFGRNLKAGDEFQSALRRFLYDGQDMSSILRHIPSILSKLQKLETLLMALHGYRFYAASLLLFYDGDAEGRDIRDVDFKMADFANCITRDSPNIAEKACPPQHPDAPDMGFLKGLRSLRLYFTRIQKEVMNEMGMEVEGQAIAWEEFSAEDLGGESY